VIERRALGNSGLEVSALAFGASSLGEEFGPVAPDAADRCVRTALDLGITLFDTSPFYGRGISEVVLGLALRGVPRGSYRLSTKLGRYDVATFDFRPERVVESVETSLRRLRTDHLDLVFCHDVEFADLSYIIHETLPALRKIKAAGKIRAIGVAGYPLKIFREIMAGSNIDAVISYCHATLQNTKLIGRLPELASNGIGVLNAAPWGMRLLTDLGAPEWHKADAETRTCCAKAAAHCRARGSDLAKLALQYSIRVPGIASTICGTADPAHLLSWVKWITEPVDEALLAEVRAILSPVADRSYMEGRPENN
jgi:aryl-alcohol dehydrogenase-like predicted oxidoreductase